MISILFLNISNDAKVSLEKGEGSGSVVITFGRVRECSKMNVFFLEIGLERYCIFYWEK